MSGSAILSDREKRYGSTPIGWILHLLALRVLRISQSPPKIAFIHLENSYTLGVVAGFAVAEPERDEEPVAVRDVYTAGLFDGKNLTPRKPFVRVSERELEILAKRYDVWTHVIRAIEDALEEKQQ